MSDPTDTQEKTFTPHPSLIHGLRDGSITQLRVPCQQPDHTPNPIWCELNGEIDGDWWQFRNESGYHGDSIQSPFGLPGDELVCLEGWMPEFVYDEDINTKFRGVRYVSPGILGQSCGECLVVSGKPGFNRQSWEIYRSTQPFSWITADTMPPWASRLTLKVGRVWVERVKEINGVKAVAEGIYLDFPGGHHGAYSRAQVAFVARWNEMYPDHPFSDNPYCFTAKVGRKG